MPRLDRTLPAILAAALAGLAPPAAATNAAATLLPGDALHGNILAPGDSDDLSLYLPGGAVFSAEALAEPGSALLPDLEMVDPDGDPVLIGPFKQPGPGGVGVRLGNIAIDGEAGGVFTFRVIGGEGTAGKYLFRCTAKFPKKFAGTPTTGQQAWTGLGFDAPAGSRLRYSMKALTVGAVLSQPRLVAPDDAVTALEGLTGKGIPLGQDGTWDLQVYNDSDANAEISIVVSLTLPKASRRVLYLSPLGFGEAPRIASIDPSKVLDDRPAPGVEILGEGFDPAAAVRLERKDLDPLSPASFEVLEGGRITADFDPQGADPGGWTLVVENPSGGEGRRRFTIQSAGQVKLPPGAVEGTEVWWIEFDRDAFRDDLALMGLGSSNPATAALAEAAVKSYALYWSRTAFGNGGGTGKTMEGSVPVSFVLEEPPSTVGAPGADYDRIRVGGAAAPADPSSNPNYAWGDGPLDPGNASYEDLSEDGGAGRGLRTRALQPSLSTATDGWNATLRPLLDNPLTTADAFYFLKDVNVSTPESGARYRAIVAAVEAAGKEIGGSIAHFVGRSMGTADGVSGLAFVPVKVGAYAALLNFAFTGPETAAMAAAVRAGLPGRAKTLRAATFPVRETLAYLLPNALSGQAYAASFGLAGGRPDPAPGDVQLDVAGFLPPGFSLSNSGVVSGTAPLRDLNNNLVGGAYRFLVRYRDAVSGEEVFFGHRINLLVDTANPALSLAEVALGTQLNTLTVNTP